MQSPFVVEKCSAKRKPPRKSKNKGTRKSPKVSPQSSPRSSQVSEEETTKTSPNFIFSDTKEISILRQLIDALKTTPTPEPNILKSLEGRHAFCKKYREYVRSGGEKSVRHFIDEGLLRVICSKRLKIPSDQVLDNDLLAFLDVSYLSDSQLEQELQDGVSMDVSLPDPEAKIISLFASLETCSNRTRDVISYR